MKARIQNCDQCKKQIAKEQEKACLGCQYEMFKLVANDVGKAMAVAMIAVCERRGRKADYIKKFYDDLIFILTYPAIFGKQRLDSGAMMAEYADKYGIDFSKVQINVETKDECFRRNKIREK